MQTGNHFIPRLVSFINKIMTGQKTFLRIKLPIMIVFGDADAIRTSHMMEFFELFGGGKKAAGPDGSGRPEAWFAILPGVTHYDSLYFPNMGMIIMKFLNFPV